MAEKVEIIIEAEDKASKVIEGIGGKLGGIASIVGKGLAIGAGVAAAGMAALGGVAAAFVKDAAESQTVSARMNAQLAALGDTAKVSAADINRLADQISKITGFDDEALVEGQTTLLRFGKLSKKQFEIATEAAADLAAMTGMDLTSAFQQVGRALEDPEQGFGRLKRQIGDMTEEQKLAIKAALEMGDTAKAQGIILDALAGKVKGAGKAMGETFKGQMDRLKVTLGNIKEDIGAALLPTIQLFADKLLSFVQSDKFQQWVENVADWLKNKLPIAIQAVSTFWTTYLQPALAAVWGFITTQLVPAFQILWDWLSSKLKPAIADLSSYWNSTLMPVLRDTYNLFMTELPAAILRYKDELALLGDALASIKDTIALLNSTIQTLIGETGPSIIDWGAAFALIIEKIGAGLDFLLSQINSFLTLFRDAMDILKALLSGNWEEILAALIKFGSDFNAAVYNILKTLVAIFADPSNWPDLKPMGRAMIDGLISGWKEGWSTFWSIVDGDFNRLLAFILAKLLIHSPSQLFAKEIGKPMAQGVQVGFGQQMGLSAKPISNMLSPRDYMDGGGRGMTPAPVTVVLNYSPAVSIASRAEAETVLGPYINDVLRQLRK